MLRLTYRNPGATLIVSFGWLFVLPVEYESLGSADWSAAIECLIGNMRVTATLDVPPSAAKSSARTCMRLETAVRVSSDGPRHGRCVLIEIPVPAGITLRPGAAIALTVCIAGSPITLRIPATGHIHCATCNHKMAGDGAVWRAANAGDAAALEAALAAGGSTEETDGVRRHLEPHPPLTVTLRLACHRC